MDRILGTAGKIKRRIEAFVLEQRRKQKLQSYIESDRRPWRTGYQEYKDLYLSKILNDERMLENFKKSEKLSNGYGFRLDARVVEIPWLLSRLNGQADHHLLDAGSSLNHKFILKNPTLANKKITIVTLAPEAQAHWRLGVSYVFEDLRKLKFRNDCFDVITCVSTIEHIGMDNSIYGMRNEAKGPEDTKQCLLAIKELKRVLKPGGAIYLTFPFGCYENHGWFQQFDAQLMDVLIREFSPSRHNETIFRYDPDGWRISDRASCSNLQFFDVHTSKYFNPNSSIEYPSDYPAGERAVACLELFK